MTTGLATANANAALAAVILDADFVQWHTGDPGANGTANVSANTTRQALTWSVPSAASVSISGTPTSGVWASGSETLTHISTWSAGSGGVFQFSDALNASKPVTNGDTFNLTTLTVAATPVAA